MKEEISQLPENVDVDASAETFLWKFMMKFDDRN